MVKYLIAAVLGLAIAQPASAARILDYNVYASGNAYISGGSYGDIAALTFTNANGITGTNFASRVGVSDAETSAARAFSTDFAALSSTGTLTSGQWTPGDATLTGTDAGINVFNIDGARWSQLYKLSFAGAGTGAIVNVSGGSLTNFVNLDFGGLLADQVVFNFFDATSVSMGGMNVRGTILAPNAKVTIQGGSVAGSVITKDFHSEGATIGGNGFTGFVSAPAVPEPATWAMLIAGFGAIGGMMRRRRGVRAALAA